MNFVAFQRVGEERSFGKREQYVMYLGIYILFAVGELRVFGLVGDV